jgi:hypothetical protein
VSLIVFTNVNHTATFNLSTGTAVAPSNATSTITNFGNGWYRCSITFTSGATGNGFFDTYINNGSTTSYVGDGTSGIFAWGAQLETGAFGTSYIPTVATSVTRNADIASMTGTNFTSWFNASEGAFMVQSNTFFAGNQGILSIGDPTKGFAARETYYCLNAAGLGGRISVQIATGGVVQFDGSPVYTFAVNTPARACFAYKTNSAAASINATANTTDTSVTLPTVTQVSIGNLNSAWSGAGTYLNGHVQRIQYWPQRLINAEVQAFSK